MPEWPFKRRLLRIAQTAENAVWPAASLSLPPVGCRTPGNGHFADARRAPTVASHPRRSSSSTARTLPAHAHQNRSEPPHRPGSSAGATPDEMTVSIRSAGPLTALPSSAEPSPACRAAQERSREYVYSLSASAVATQCGCVTLALGASTGIASAIAA